MSKSKQIGTATETLAVKHAKLNGFPWADRQALHGNKDVGDVWLDPIGKAMVEVKGGHTAETASDEQVLKWMAETDVEKGHAGADVAFLLTKRKGAGPAKVGTWRAHFWLSTLYSLRGYPLPVEEDGVVTMSFDSALAQLRAAGYGSPLDSPSEGVKVEA